MLLDRMWHFVVLSYVRLCDVVRLCYVSSIAEPAHYNFSGDELSPFLSVCLFVHAVFIVIDGLYRRNKRHLENEIARGMGKSLDPLKLAEELYWREEGRKVL